MLRFPLLSDLVEMPLVPDRSRRNCLLLIAGATAMGPSILLASDETGQRGSGTPRRGASRQAASRQAASPQAASPQDKEERFMPEYFVDRLETLPRTEAEWARLLTAERFKVLRKKKTERAFSGELWNNKQPGVYGCAGCGEPLFGSYAKYESGTGWPSFWRPLSPRVVATRADNTFFMRRVEVICARCEGHLGHVFQDGPPPTGLRYCMNSAALRFEEERSEDPKPRK